MSLAKVLIKCGNGSSRLASSLILRNASQKGIAKPSNFSLVQKRLLISSSETGGLKPMKPPRRIETRHKLIAGALLTVSFVESYYLSTNEEAINKFLGTGLNTSAVALVYQICVGFPLGYIVFAATLPF